MLRLLALVTLLTTTAFGSWERHVYTGIGEGYVYAPPPHPLSFLRMHPCLRPAELERVGQCFADGKPPADAFKVLRTDLKLVGKVDGFSIFELSYYFDDSNTIGMSSVLVQTGPDEFHEIYDSEVIGPGAGLESRVVDADGTQLLEVTYFTGGAYDGGLRHFLAFFGKDGPTHLDFTPVYEAAGKAGGGWELGAEFDFANMTWTSSINPEGLKMSCCTGNVTVTFRVEHDGRVVPTATKRELNAQN